MALTTTKTFGPVSLVTKESQKFRSAKTPQGIVIFPFPPIKGKKWLIVIQDEENLAAVLSALNSGELPNPLDDLSPYQEAGTHSDGQTPLFQLKDEHLHS